MYSSVVMNLLILEILFQAINCIYLAEAELRRHQSSKKNVKKQFDQAEFPNDGALPLLNRKVFKARRVSIREHPYVASIRRNVAHYSVGCILSNNVVLTVAFPLFNVSVAELTVVVGENYADRGSMLHTVILKIEHKHFNPYTLENDVAMLRIFEDITFKGSAKAIPLIYENDLIYGRKAFVTGWGRCDRMGKELCLPRSTRYTSDERLDPMLRTATFTVVDLESNKYCNLYHRNELPLPNGMLCLGESREVNPVMPCLAVPGAPLALGARLAAILSWGFGCCHLKDLPLIYTDIQYYHKWIETNLHIMRNISKAYLLKLFQAQRAYILKEWLHLTRLLPTHEYVIENKPMMILRVDRELAKFSGNVYDIRDYLFNGELHSYKIKVYKKLRETAALEADRDTKNQFLKLDKKVNETLQPVVYWSSDTSYFESSLTEVDDELEEEETNEDYII